MHRIRFEDGRQVVNWIGTGHPYTCPQIATVLDKRGVGADIGQWKRIAQVLAVGPTSLSRPVALNGKLRLQSIDALGNELLGRPRIAVFTRLQVQRERRIGARIGRCRLSKAIDEPVDIALEAVAQGITDLV